MRRLISSDAMTRTTIDLDPSILHELRRRAEHERKSIGRVASELLAQQLAPDQPASPLQPLRWVSRGLGVPRVDLEDKETVGALLDEQV